MVMVIWLVAKYLLYFIWTHLRVLHFHKLTHLYFPFQFIFIFIFSLILSINSLFNSNTLILYHLSSQHYPFRCLSVYICMSLFYNTKHKALCIFTWKFFQKANDKKRKMIINHMLVGQGWGARGGVREGERNV